MATTTLQNAATSNGNGTAATGLTGPCTIVFSGTFNEAACGVEISTDGGTTYVPVDWIASRQSPGCVNVEIFGTYSVRAPIYGCRATGSSITVVASYD